jgi:putative membrane protein
VPIEGMMIAALPARGIGPRFCLHLSPGSDTMKTPIVLAAAIALTATSFSVTQSARSADTDNRRPQQMQSQNQQNQQSQEQEFVHDAASGNKMEIEIGKYMLDRTQNPQSKALAQMLVQDHQNAQQKLQAAAQKAGVKFDDDLTPVHKAEFNELKQKDPKDLDRCFAFSAIADHHKDILVFTYASNTLKNQDLKNFANENLPVLRKHLQQADKLAQSVAGVSDSTVATER